MSLNWRQNMRIIAAIVAAALCASQTTVSAQDNPGNKTNVKVSAEGKELYEQVCQACHMANAKGGAGAGTGVPALAGNPKLANKAYAISTLWNGRAGMPRFGELITPAQAAAVLTYVRSHFNTYRAPVTEAEVKAFAKKPLAKSDCNRCGH